MPIRFNLSRRAARFLPLLALSVLAAPCSGPVLAQTTVGPPVTQDGSVVVVPGGPKQVGTPVVVVAAVDTSGNAETAKKALSAAQAALAEVPGYSPVSVQQFEAAKDAAAKMKDVDWTWPFTATDYQKIGKAFGGPKGKNAPHALTISLTPSGATYGAAAELYDTVSGGLVGYGAGVSVDGADPVDSAVARAVRALGNTATFNGVVISRPTGLRTRISVGEQAGLRGGARVEYLENGIPIAFGTVIDLGFAESVATVAPETAFPSISVNTPVRIVNNPPAKRALPTVNQKSDAEQKKFERSFVLSTGVALAVYYLAIR